MIVATPGWSSFLNYLEKEAKAAKKMITNESINIALSGGADKPQVLGVSPGLAALRLHALFARGKGGWGGAVGGPGGGSSPVYF